MALYSSVTTLISLLMVAMAIYVLTHPGFHRKQKTWSAVTFFSIAFSSKPECAARTNEEGAAYEA